MQAAGPRVPGSLPPVWNTPARSSMFTGRSELLRQLRQSLLSGQRAAVFALSGLGGVGKSQLAVEYAHRFAGEYELVWWVNADNPTLIGEQLAGLAAEVAGAGPGPDIPSAVKAMRAMLAGRDRWLLVFDNASAAKDLVAWIPQGPGHVIITSRSPAWAGLAIPVSVDVLDRHESIALLKGYLP
jgi:hypothetical protein